MLRFTILETKPTETGPRSVLAQSHALMNSLYPADACHYLDVEQLDHPRIYFLAARNEQGETIGTGALSYKNEWPEIKSMFTLDAARGYGAGAGLLTALIEKANALNLSAVYLETGVGLDAAHRLYERFGFQYCEAFGAYTPQPLSIFMTKTLR